MSGDGSDRHNACVRARVLPPPPISAVQADRKVDARIPHTNIKSVLFRRLDGEHWTGSVADVGRCLIQYVLILRCWSLKSEAGIHLKFPTEERNLYFFIPLSPRAPLEKSNFLLQENLLASLEASSSTR